MADSKSQSSKRSDPLTSNQDPSVPKGLEPLLKLDRLLLKQHKAGDTKLRYFIRDSKSRDVFSAEEKASSSCALVLGVRDPYGQEVLRFVKPFVCIGPEVINAEAQNEQIGSIIEDNCACSGKLSVKNGAGRTVLRLQGPNCCAKAWGCKDAVFMIMGSEGNNFNDLGSVTWKYMGCCRCGNEWELNFPQDLDVKVKAVLIGTVFLMDVMYFEPHKHQ